MSHPIYPCIWFNQDAAEAAQFYLTAIPGTMLLSSNPMVVTLKILDQKFMFLNGGPMFKPNPAISYFLLFETEAETEQVYHNLAANGSELMPLGTFDWSSKYGWVNDQYNISWQIFTGSLDQVGQQVTPSLMFTHKQNGKAESAIRFYTAIFKNSEVGGILRYDKDEDVEGNVKHAQYKINGQTFMSMDSSIEHNFVFTEGNSFVIECDTQEEIDFYWNALTQDGEESMCGWLRDKFGVSWQVVPAILPTLMSDPVKGPKVMAAFLKMKKFDLNLLLNL